MNLFKEYGYITLPKGFKLYHYNDTNKIPNLNNLDNNTLFCMFTPNNWSYKFEVTLTKSIQLLFVIDDKNKGIASIYNEFIQKENITYDSIKKNKTKRDNLISHFRKHGISGWVTPLDYNIPYECCLLEVCIFDENPFDVYKIQTIKTIPSVTLYSSLKNAKFPVVLGTQSKKYLENNKQQMIEELNMDNGEFDNGTLFRIGGYI